MKMDVLRSKRAVHQASQKIASLHRPTADQAIDNDYFRDKKGRDSIGYLVREANRFFSRELQVLVEKLGITTAQWYFLRVLWEQDGLTQSELSSRVGLMTATTVTALNTLERKGLIKRHKHPTDRRKFSIYLTKAGRQLERNGLKCGKDVNNLASRNLSPEAIEITRTSLRIMCENLAHEIGD